MKKWFALLLSACLLCGMLAACQGKKVEITQDEAIQKVLKDIEETYGEEIAATVGQPHIHLGTYEGKPCFNIYITVSNMSLQYVISMTGDILHAGAGEHSH